MPTCSRFLNLNSTVRFGPNFLLTMLAVFVTRFVSKLRESFLRASRCLIILLEHWFQQRCQSFRTVQTSPTRNSRWVLLWTRVIAGDKRNPAILTSRVLSVIIVTSYWRKIWLSNLLYGISPHEVFQTWLINTVYHKRINRDGRGV